jgi:hypothetical protein
MTRRWLLLALAPTGTFAAHALAYGPFAAGHGDDAGLHGYLPLLAVVAVPVAVAALVWATTCRRGRASQLPSAGALVGVQVGMFAVQEVLERVASGVSVSDVLHLPAVRWGVALQLVTAAGTVLAIRVLRRAVGAFMVPVTPCGLFVVGSSSLVAVRGAERTVAGAVSRARCRAPPVVAA